MVGCAKQCNLMPNVENKDSLDHVAKVDLLRSCKFYYSGSNI